MGPGLRACPSRGGNASPGSGRLAVQVVGGQAEPYAGPGRGAAFQPVAVDQRRGEGKMQKAEGRLTGWAGVKRRFVCLDEIEYPGEHDDILIMFDTAEGEFATTFFRGTNANMLTARDRFADALPAATMERKFTVRRKI